MQPPSGVNGEEPLVNCGWHQGSCFAGRDGVFLDWNDTTTKLVFFRGFFKRSDSPIEFDRLVAETTQETIGVNVCDSVSVDIKEAQSGACAVRLWYSHMALTAPQSIVIPTSGHGVVYEEVLGEMVDESGDISGPCVGFQPEGFHVHAGVKENAGGVAMKQINEVAYTQHGDYCDPGPCEGFYNDLLEFWTHKFTWLERGSKVLCGTQ